MSDPADDITPEEIAELEAAYAGSSQHGRTVRLLAALRRRDVTIERLNKTVEVKDTFFAAHHRVAREIQDERDAAKDSEAEMHSLMVEATEAMNLAGDNHAAERAELIAARDGFRAQADAAKALLARAVEVVTRIGEIVEHCEPGEDGYTVHELSRLLLAEIEAEHGKP